MRKFVLPASVGILLSCGLIAAAPASAAPAIDGIFNLTGTPHELAVGADGNVWTPISGSGAGNDLARIAPDGTVTEFDADNAANAIGITSGPDGNLWLTRANAIARVDPANPTAAQQFAVGAVTDPRGITNGPDGNLWAASGDKLVKIPPANPAGFEQFTIAGMGARGIASAGGNLWIADFGSARIVSATTAGAPTFYDVGDGPQGISAGAGEQIAYSNPGAMPQTIGRITPPGPAQTTDTPGVDPFGVALGADGAFWFAQFNGQNLGRLTTDGAYTTLGTFAAGSGPRTIAAGPGNTLWVGLELSKQIGRVTGVDPPPAPDPTPDPTPDPDPDPMPEPTGAPEATLTKTPKNKLRASRKGAKVTYRFRSDPAGADFQCALKRKGKRSRRYKKLAKFAPCASPKKYRRLGSGRYRFVARALSADGTPGIPAKDGFQVKRRR